MPSTEFKPSKRTEEALRHLKNVKPLDGWSVDIYINASGKRLVMLRRRNVPLGSSGFEDIVLHDQIVVGITSYTAAIGDAKYGKGLSLVEKDGTVCRTPRDIRVRLTEVKPSADRELNASRERMRADRERARASVASRDRASASEPATSNGILPLSDEANKQLLTYFFFGVCALTVLKTAFALISVSIVFLPITYLYASQTCPSRESFDAKKELKRVMRGEQLPEDHPDKPKDWLSQSIARVSSSIGTELATSLGYEVSLTDYFGACCVASVRVPTIDLDFYWIGAFGKWRFLMQREIAAQRSH